MSHNNRLSIKREKFRSCRGGRKRSQMPRVKYNYQVKKDAEVTELGWKENNHALEGTAKFTTCFLTAICEFLKNLEGEGGHKIFFLLPASFTAGG